LGLADASTRSMGSAEDGLRTVRQHSDGVATPRAGSRFRWSRQQS